MSPLSMIARTSFLGAVWSIVYFAFFRGLLFAHWNFDLVRYKHWVYIWNLWQGGWVLDEAREWGFVLLLLVLFPLWLTGWTAVCWVPWGGWSMFMVKSPYLLMKFLFGKKEEPIAPVRVVPKQNKKKKKTHKRPPAARAMPKQPVYEEEEPEAEEEDVYAEEEQASAITSVSEDDFLDEPEPYEAPPSYAPSPSAAPAAPAATAKPAAGGSVEDAFSAAGYHVMNDISFGAKKVDMMAVDGEKVILCLRDAEEGDWLADEERFNDEDPLWFSESSHRVSPVRRLMDVRDAFEDALNTIGETVTIKAMVVVQAGTVINAEDMVEIWDDLNISVSRLGAPSADELPQLSDIMPAAEGAVDMDEVELLQRLAD